MGKQYTIDDLAVAMVATSKKAYKTICSVKNILVARAESQRKEKVGKRQNYRRRHDLPLSENSAEAILQELTSRKSMWAEFTASIHSSIITPHIALGIKYAMRGSFNALFTITWYLKLVGFKNIPSAAQIFSYRNSLVQELPKVYAHSYGCTRYLDVWQVVR